MTQDHDQPAPQPVVPENAEVITLGAGCFWCTEAVFQQLPGVLQAVSGYMGGHVKNPTYEQICGGATGHAEVTQIVFDPTQLSLAQLLETFWHMHDPTTLNRQGADVGPQYRSAIFHHREAQREVIDRSKADAGAAFSGPIVTEVAPAAEFYPAENHHQDYYRSNKSRNPYCRAVITPKLRKLGLQE